MKQRKKEKNKHYQTRKYLLDKFGNPNKSKRDMIKFEKEIRKLLNGGIKRKEICGKLEIHPKTLQRRIKELRNEGLIQ